MEQYALPAPTSPVVPAPADHPMPSQAPWHARKAKVTGSTSKWRGIFVFFLVSFFDFFVFRGFWLLASVAFGFCGFWLLWLLAFVAFGFCGFCLLWLLAIVAFVASVAFGFCGFWLFGLSIYLSIPIYLSYLSIYLSFFWQLFSFLFLSLLFLLFSFQRRNQTRKQASKQASKRELLTFGSGVLLGGALRPPPMKCRGLLVQVSLQWPI